MPKHFHKATPKHYLLIDLRELVGHPLPNISRLTVGELEGLIYAINTRNKAAEANADP